VPSDASFLILRTNETVSGVLGGVLPNTDAPGMSAALMPDSTAVGVFGPGVEATAALEAVRGAATRPAPSSIPAASRTLLMRIMCVVPSCVIAIPAAAAVSREGRTCRFARPERLVLTMQHKSGFKSL
jgi:hypothetical protein